MPSDPGPALGLVDSLVGHSVMEDVSPDPGGPGTAGVDSDSGGDPRPLATLWRPIHRRLALGIGLPLLGAFFALTATRAFGQEVLWENAHWTVAMIVAFLVAVPGPSTTRHERWVRRLFALGFGSYLAGQFLWDAQVAVGLFAIPAPSDLFYLSSVFPILAALAIAVYGSMSKGEWLAAFATITAVFFALATVILAVLEHQAAAMGGVEGFVFLAYPIAFSGIGGASVIAAAATRARPGSFGLYLIAAGLAGEGIAWVGWSIQAANGYPPPGSLSGYAWSVAWVVAGLGVATWNPTDSRSGSPGDRTETVLGFAPVGAVALAGATAVLHGHVAGLDTVDLMVGLTLPFAALRQTVLLRERGQLLVVARSSAERERILEAEDDAAHTAVLSSLAHLTASETPEETAAEICAALRTVVDVVAVFELADESRVALLAQDGRLVTPARIADPIPEPVARYMWEHAASGPWIDSGPGIVDGWAPGDQNPVAGARGAVCVPIGNPARPVAVFVGSVGGSADPDRLRRRMPAIVEYAMLAGALLGPPMEARSRRAASRETLLKVMVSAAFTPFFQPIVDLGSGRAVGHEALTRFADGTPPAQRFAEAESLGLEIEFEQACIRATLAAEPMLPPGSWLSVNMSPKLLVADDNVVGLLGRTGRSIVIEVTEHTSIDDYQVLRTAIDRLRLRLNARLAIDDAGAGYASFKHILELKPDFVKLDISIVSGIDRDAGRQALVAGMAYFARETSCTLIAEGIESFAELDRLRKLGITLGQGYLLGLPAPLVAEAAVNGARVDGPSPSETD